MGAADDFLDGKQSADDFLNAGAGELVVSNLRKIEAMEAAEKFEEPSSFQYLFNRLRKGFAGFMGVPGDLYQALKPTTQNMRDRASNPNIAMTEEERQLINRAADERDRAGPATSYAGRVLEHPIATSGDYREVLGVDEKMKTKRDLLRYAGGVAEMAGSGGPFALSSRAAQIPAIVTSTVGSGIGMEAGGDVASGLGLSRQAGEVVGSLAGGVASAVAPNALTAAWGVIKRRFSTEANKAAAESQVGREIAQQLESYPPAAGNIERSLQISDEIHGFNPSLPARSASPGLLAEEKRLVAQNPRTLNRAAQTIEENNKAIAEYLNTKFPVASGGETAAARVGRLQRQSADRLEQMRTAVDDKLDDAVRVFETNPSNFENGQRLRDLFFKQKEVYQGIRSQKYQDVYKAADEAGVRVDLTDIKQYVDDVLKSEMNAYQAPDIPVVFRQVAKQEAADVSFANLHSLYKQVNKDIASLRGSNAVDKDFRTMLLNDLKSKLTGKLETFEQAGYGDVATKLKEANRFFVEEYMPRFKQGFGSDLAARYSSGEFKTADQMITDLVTKPRNTQAARDFKLLFDETPEAMEALKNGYLDKFYKAGGAIDKSGRINQRALDTFIRQHGDTLAEFPEIRKTMQGLSADNQALLDRQAMLVKAEKKLAANDLYKLFQGRDPQVVLTEATTNKNAMRVLSMVAAKDQNMSRGLARGIAEHVAEQPDPAAFLKANEEAIRIGLRPLGEEHFKNLKTAVEAMTINARNPAPASINAGSAAPDALAETMGSSPRAIISHVLNVERGRSGAVQEGAAFLGRWFDKLRRDHKAVAMESVFYSKDTAKALAELAKNPANPKAQMDWINQMTALGIRAEVAGQE